MTAQHGTALRPILTALLACCITHGHATQLNDPAQADLVDANVKIARTAREIEHRIADQIKRPSRTFITPSTKTFGYAVYYNNVKRQEEEFGTQEFPTKMASRCTAV